MNRIYMKCDHWDKGTCTVPKFKACSGTDMCVALKIDGRAEVIGQNGNTGEHYLVEAVAKLLAGDNPELPLGGRNKGKMRWMLYIDTAMKVIEEVRRHDS